MAGLGINLKKGLSIDKEYTLLGQIILITIKHIHDDVDGGTTDFYERTRGQAL